MTSQPSNHIVKFADDKAVRGLITHCDPSTGRGKTGGLVQTKQALHQSKENQGDIEQCLSFRQVRGKVSGILKAYHQVFD